MKYLRIKVIPKSNRNEIVEVLKEDTPDGPVETIKIKIKATPEKGKANEELIKFLSKHFDINKIKIKIISGKSSQLKLIKIDD